MTQLHERPARLKLAPLDPLVCQILDSVGVERGTSEFWEAQAFGRALIASRAAWSAVNRNGRQYSDRDAPGPLVRPRADRG